MTHLALNEAACMPDCAYVEAYFEACNDDAETQNNSLKKTPQDWMFIAQETYI